MTPRRNGLRTSRTVELHEAGSLGFARDGRFDSLTMSVVIAQN